MSFKDTQPSVHADSTPRSSGKTRRQRKAERKKAARSREASGPRRARSRDKLAVERSAPARATVAADTASAPVAAGTAVAHGTDGAPVIEHSGVLAAAELPVANASSALDVAPAVVSGSSREADLEFELQFFDSVRPPAPALPIEDDPELAPLSPEQLGRRLRLRRKVMRLMAGLGAFSAVVTAIRVVELL